MNPSAKTVESYSQSVMNNSFRVVQLNVRGRGGIHDGLMNGPELQDASVILIQEPQARNIGGRLLTTPMMHHKWTKMTPSTWSDGRWAVRSMMWINRNLEAEQLPVDSPDLTAAILRLEGRLILVVSVYIAGQDDEALRSMCTKVRRLIKKTRKEAGQEVDVLLAGDFNRHDQLWGGEEVSLLRQGEADRIIELMGEFSLSSLLPRGTKTWHDNEYESTIDLVLASEGLAENVVSCGLHDTDHGSDHEAIVTTFDIEAHGMEHKPRLLFKNTPWKSSERRDQGDATGCAHGWKRTEGHGYTDGGGA